ncbi:Uncharacterised protein [Prevotella disiens]|uniref:Uncharacterized protein n=1 Tax=Prevotella disiens TaxID=28130 RepID=A0A379EFE9_9BACT|nr:Uncharacterised protein [Prevotella disiens]
MQNPTYFNSRWGFPNLVKNYIGRTNQSSKIPNHILLTLGTIALQSCDFRFIEGYVNIIYHY